MFSDTFVSNDGFTHIVGRVGKAGVVDAIYCIIGGSAEPDFLTLYTGRIDGWAEPDFLTLYAVELAGRRSRTLF